MLIEEVFKVALGAVAANKMRSLLTALGIVIGVAAVITMVALGTGAQKSVQEQIESLGTNLLSVYAGQSFSPFGVASSNRVSLTSEDADALRAEATMLSAVVPELAGNYQVEYGTRNINVSVNGTVPEYVSVYNHTVVHGRNLSQGENDARKRVAVVGNAVPEMLGLNDGTIVGREISIRGIRFEVIGVLEEKGSMGPGSDPDEQVLIPMETAQYRITGSDRLKSITVQVAHPDSMTVAMIEIEGILRREHGIVPGEDNDFNMRDRAEFLETFEQTTETFTFLLGGIAAVSLIVGGIGIMNIMLVSVTERTREIGVRKALGATRNSLMLQFLVEALVLCLMGGLIGVLTGIGGAIALAEIAGWNTSISIQAIFVAVAFSAAVGLFFGLWPARRASKLDPIEALRYE